MHPTIDGQHFLVFTWWFLLSQWLMTTVPWRTPHVWSVERLRSSGVLGLEQGSTGVTTGECFFIPYHPWDWYIYLHEWLIFVANGRQIYHRWMLWVLSTSAHVLDFDKNAVGLVLSIHHDSAVSVNIRLLATCCPYRENPVYLLGPTSKRIESYQLFRCYVTTSCHVYYIYIDVTIYLLLSSS